MCFVDLGYRGAILGLVALGTSSNCLYTTFWIHPHHGQDV